MKNIKAHLFVLFLISLSYSSNAQDFRWMVSGNVGVSKIPNWGSQYTGEHNDRFSLKNWAFSYQYGSGIEIKLSEQVFIETGLYIYSINDFYKSEDNLFFPQISPISSVVTSRSTSRINSFYLGIPVSLKRKINRFGLATGLKILYFLKSNGKSTFTNSLSPDTTVLIRELFYRKFDFGPSLTFSYDIHSAMALQLDFYYGLMNTTPSSLGSVFSSNKKNQQLTLGLNYYL